MYTLRTFAIILFLAGPVAAGDWSQWLGPNRDSSSSEAVSAWKEAPKALWRVPVGEGHSSPAVAGNFVYIHAKIKDRNEEEVVAYDRMSGEVKWRTKYERAAAEFQFGNGPRATPAVAGDRVYTYGITGVLTCLNATSGDKVWQVDVRKEFSGGLPGFGFASSPLIDGKHVIVAVGAKGASVVAFDRDSGKVAWKSLDDGASYASPALFGSGDKRELVVFTSEGLVSLKPADGSLTWRFPFKDTLFESSATPIKIGDRYLASAITIGSALVTPEGQGVKEIWKNPALNSYFTTPVPVGKNHVLMVTGRIIRPAATLHCVDLATGKPVWSKERVGTYAASLLTLADGKVLMLTDGGNLVLLEGDTKEYKELARSKVCGQAWPPPALSDGKLYVRDEKELICLQLGK
jgi:outer membrane protein assembly factor BamB